MKHLPKEWAIDYACAFTQHAWVFDNLCTHINLSSIVVERSVPACQKLEASFAIDLGPGYGVQKACVKKKKRVGKTKLTKIKKKYVVGRSAER